MPLLGQAKTCFFIYSIVSATLEIPSAATATKWDWIALEGNEANDFAQAQFASDVKTLAIGASCLSACLSAKGRVIAVFVLHREREDRLLAALPYGRGEELAAYWRKFVLRRKVKIELAANEARVPLFDFTQADSSLKIELQTREHRETDFGIASTDAEASNATTATTARISATENMTVQTLTRWQNQLPLLSAARAEHFTAHALGLQRFNAISVNKGCYPGQEIVARTHFLGRNPRGLAVFRCPEFSDVTAAIGELEQAGIEVVEWILSDGELRVIGSGNQEKITELRATNTFANQWCLEKEQE